MGVAQQGVYGNWYQKTGNVVARQVKGRTIYSIYQPKVHNPKTDAQETVRMKFRLLSLIGARLRTALVELFANLDGYEHGTWLSSFVGFNFKYDDSAASAQKLFTGAYPNISLNMQYLQVSPATGELPILMNASADPEGTNINVTWTNDSSAGTGSANTDKVSFVLVNSSMRAQLAFIDDATRQAQTTVLRCPNAWSGQSCHTYAVVRSADNQYYSHTQYLGEITF